MEQKTAAYLTVVGKAPRKRKSDHFERRLPESATSLMLMTQAKEMAMEIVRDNKLRDAKASFAYWGISESSFIDADGNEETIVFRNIFPSSQSQAVDLN